jgi:type VI secretion system FHA domain protein
VAQLLAAAGIETSAVKQGDAETAALVGDLLRRLVAGLFVLLAARARAKSQMGAEGTSFSAEGNNPLKFARTADQALLQLLNPPERGFQSADRAIEDAFKDLQAHQMATLHAMRGALRATLDRFSPSAIRARAQDQGLLAKILPGARDAALWHAYEKEFGGVVVGSDEAFMDMFAKEFRRAYEEIARKG